MTDGLFYLLAAILSFVFFIGSLQMEARGTEAITTIDAAQLEGDQP